MRSTITAFAAAAMFVLSPMAAKAETLADALASAYETSGLLDQNRALLRAADEGVAQAMAGLRPILNWSAQATGSTASNAAGDNWSASLGISGELNLFDNGATQFAIDAQKETVLGTRQSLIAVEQQVLLRAIQAYMNVRRDSEFVTLRQSNVRVITQEFRAAQDRFDVGEITRTDVALAEARLAAARSLLSAAEGTLARSAEEYAAAVGRRPGTLAPVSAAPLARSEDDAKAFALRNHPALREAQFSVSAAELTILRAEAAMKPSVSLSGRVTLDQDFNDSGSVTLGVGGPIYQGGLLSSRVRQVQAQRDATRAGLHLTAVNVEQGVGNAYANFAVAQASKRAFDQQIQASQTAFNGIREEAQLGARTTIDVLNAEQELLDARASLVSAQADEVVASYAILSSMGLLTADHLGLNVQRYDPEAYYNLVKDAPTATSAQGQALDRVLDAIGGN